ncbi:uncharacterized protein LOC113347429 [Papaver somniferum]|uniref:uncharacterized protein LOC113347429 n=1 Tax=Papaver somniferum TaxID=3469 RepID=UPI000E6FB730|nr:uncharacterized protein LOC113347429 [Papaver somniferum]
MVGWEGTAHDSRVLIEAVRDPSFKFPLPPPDKYYLCDVAYSHTQGFIHPYRNIRYWIGDYRRVPPTAKEEKFNQAHARLRNVIETTFGVLKVEVEVEAETEENAPRLFGRQEQIYMNNLRDEIASLF